MHHCQPGTLVSITETLNIACGDNKQIAVKILSCDEGIMTADQFMEVKKMELKINY
jgi:methionyl-tRNA formyltransferase